MTTHTENPEKCSILDALHRIYKGRFLSASLITTLSPIGLLIRRITWRARL